MSAKRGPEGTVLLTSRAGENGMAKLAGIYGNEELKDIPLWVPVTYARERDLSVGT
jgi:hypothetical protein